MRGMAVWALLWVLAVEGGDKLAAEMVAHKAAEVSTSAKRPLGRSWTWRLS